MQEDEYRLSAAGLASLSPIHFWTNTDLEIVHASPLLAELLPTIATGDTLAEHFQLQRPALKALNFDSLRKFTQSKVVLESTSRQDFRLDGELVESCHQGSTHLVFAGRPVATSMSDLVQHSIPGSAYSVQDYYLDMLMTVEREAAMRSQLTQRTERLRLESLVGVYAQRLYSCPDVDTLYQQITQVGLELLHLDDLVVYRVEGDILYQVSVSGASGQADLAENGPLVLHPGQGIVGNAFQSRRVVYAADTSEHPEYVSDDFAGKSEFAVPLLFKGECFGVLDSESPRRDDYSMELRDTLTKFADIAAAAVCHFQQTLEIHRSLIEKQKQFESRDLTLRAAAHEVRTPLAQISSTIEVLRRAARVFTPEKIVEYLELLSEPLDRLESFAVAMLREQDVNETSSEPGAPKTSKIELGEFTRQLATTTARAFGRSKDLSVVIPPKPISLEIHAESYAQIVTNLISNALKYSSAGSEVRIEMRESQNGLLIDVSDKGIGIPANLIGAIFEPFMRHPGAISKASGTGLGLSIAQENARKIGGRISVSSVVGEGTLFTLALPQYV